MKEPPEMMLRFCPVCGRTDRYTSLKDRHFSLGTRCKGTPVRILYKPATK